MQVCITNEIYIMVQYSGSSWDEDVTITFLPGSRIRYVKVLHNYHVDDIFVMNRRKSHLINLWIKKVKK